MEQFPLVWVLPIATFVLLIAGALWSRKRTLDRMEDDSIPKSSLAIDAPSDRRAP